MEKEGEGPAEAGGEADNAEYTQLYGEQPDKTWVKLALALLQTWRSTCQFYGSFAWTKLIEKKSLEIILGGFISFIVSGTHHNLLSFQYLF